MGVATTKSVPELSVMTNKHLVLKSARTASVGNSSFCSRLTNNLAAAGKCVSAKLPGLALVLLGLMLAGCAGFGGGSGVVYDDFEDENLASITDSRARRMLINGDIKGASDRYSVLATEAAQAGDPLTSMEHSLVAAEILYDRGLTEEGKLKLAAIPQPMAVPALQHRQEILTAKDILFANDAEAALLALPDPAEVESSLHRARIFEVRAQSFRQLANPDEELQARIQLEQEVRRPAIVAANHRQIWQMLSTQPLSTLGEMTTNVRGEIYQGWIQLALANAGTAATNGDATARQANLQAWGSNYPNHPAQATVVRGLFGGSRFEGLSLAGGPIRQVGVLLPLSAPGIGAAAEAIREGIIIAYQNEEQRDLLPAVRFYDIGDNINFVRTAFQNAVNDGSDAIIGPLRKEAVNAIITQRDLPVPVITLNQVESTGGIALQNVIQFGLAPEDEARSAASRALALDHRNAIVLQSDDSRGDRAARAFTEAMILNGGDVLHTAVLPADQFDYSRELKDALLITQSDQRFRNLSRALDTKLFFEPGIRGDVDMVFMAVTNEQARSVRPQLAFFHAGKLPMLGTSRVAAIDDDIKANRDLNGIQFTDAPWTLDRDTRRSDQYQQIAQAHPDSIEVFGKLYALGIDAWKLVNNLESLTTDSSTEIPGFTGQLSLTADGRIQRKLMWAQYQDGKTTPLENIDFTPASGLSADN